MERQGGKDIGKDKCNESVFGNQATDLTLVTSFKRLVLELWPESAHGFKMEQINLGLCHC